MPAHRTSDLGQQGDVPHARRVRNERRGALCAAPPRRVPQRLSPEEGPEQEARRAQEHGDKRREHAYVKHEQAPLCRRRGRQGPVQQRDAAQRRLGRVRKRARRRVRSVHGKQLQDRLCEPRDLPKRTRAPRRRVAARGEKTQRRLPSRSLPATVPAPWPALARAPTIQYAL